MPILYMQRSTVWIAGHWGETRIAGRADRVTGVVAGYPWSRAPSAGTEQLTTRRFTTHHSR